MCFICTPCACRVLRDQKRALELLRLKLDAYESLDDVVLEIKPGPLEE